MNFTVPPDAFVCSCQDGFAAGICAYDGIALEYTSDCQSLGVCGVDVDECLSSPCQNKLHAYNMIGHSVLRYCSYGDYI